MPKIISLLIIPFLIATSLWMMPVQAQTWKIACEEDFPPYNFLDEKKNKIGLDTEIVAAVLAYLDVKYELNVYPWKRVVNLLDTHQVHMAYQFVGSPERFSSYLLIGPIRSGFTVFFVHKDSAIQFNTLDDLRPYTIGTVKGFKYTNEFDQADFLKKDDSAIDNEQLVKKLAVKRVDMIIGDRDTLSFLARRAGVYDQIQLLPKVLREVPRYVGFHTSERARAGLFAHGLNAIIANGTHAQIVAKWR